jgi:hypothetical protein
MDNNKNDHQTLQSLVRQAASEIWIEHTESDEKVLTKVQQDTIAFCVSILFIKGFGPAGLELLRLLPKERISELLN